MDVGLILGSARISGLSERLYLKYKENYLQVSSPLLLCSVMEIPRDLITSVQAREMLGVSTKKMAQLLKQGVITHFPDPLDARKKLVSKSAIMSLKVPRLEAA